MFAAPRSSGIWTEVREEIAGSLRESGGEAQEDTGPFGPELHARLKELLLQRKVIKTLPVTGFSLWSAIGFALLVHL